MGNYKKLFKKKNFKGKGKETRTSGNIKNSGAEIKNTVESWKKTLNFSVCKVGNLDQPICIKGLTGYLGTARPTVKACHLKSTFIFAYAQKAASKRLSQKWINYLLLPRTLKDLGEVEPEVYQLS